MVFDLKFAVVREEVARNPKSDYETLMGGLLSSDPMGFPNENRVIKDYFMYEYRYKIECVYLDRCPRTTTGAKILTSRWSTAEEGLTEPHREYPMNRYMVFSRRPDFDGSGVPRGW